MNASATYAKDGYLIKKNLIDRSRISNLLESYESFKNRGSIYYSQSNHNWRNTNQDIDAYGHLEKSIENFTDIIWAPRLSSNGKKILLSKDIQNCLWEISGTREEFCLRQNMLFDKSTGTIDHIDSKYLDTDPMGHLIGAWIALEDIHGNGGEFHVYPGSHQCPDNKPETWKDLTHDQFVEWSENLRKKFRRTPIHLRAGDVLFWHPSLLHGSTNQRLEGNSRKSLTAHYYPATYKRGGKGVITDPSDQLHQQTILRENKKLRKFGSLPIYTKKRRSSIFWSLTGATIYMLNKNNQDRMLMNRSSYEVEQ